MTYKRILAAAFAFAVLMSFGAEITYTGATKGSWFVDSNWSTGSQPTGEDDVIIPAGKIVKATTDVISCYSLTITGSGAELDLGSASLAPQTIATIAGDLTVTEGAVLHVYAGALPEALRADCFTGSDTDSSHAASVLYANPTVVSVGGAFTVSGGGIVYPENESMTGTSVFFKTDDFILAADGEINTEKLGWTWKDFSNKSDETGHGPLPAGARASHWNTTSYHYTYAFGAGLDYNWGAGYGGLATSRKTMTSTDGAGTNMVPQWASGQTYGSACAPFLPGSPSGVWGASFSRGSGAIVVFATGDATLAGTLAATGRPYTEYRNLPGTSGGAIWICGKSVALADTSSIMAEGGCSLAYSNSGGGGGRISFGIGLTQSQIDTLASGATPGSDVSVETLTSTDTLSVRGGADSRSTPPVYGDPGTITRVTAMSGRTWLTLAGNPLEAISENITYATTPVDCEVELAYTADAYGKDPDDPVGTCHPCLGWVLSNATACVTNDDTRFAVFTLNELDGPYTLTWQWGDAVSTHVIAIDCPGGGTITVDGVTYSKSVSLPIPAAPEVLTATAKSGYRFLGWTGLPTGFTTNASVTVTVASGMTITALFAEEGGAGVAKTWTGATSTDWDTASNWSPEGVPTLVNDVVIANAASRNCFLLHGAAVRSLTVESNRSLHLAASGTLTYDYKGILAPPTADTTDTQAFRYLYIQENLSVTGLVVVGGLGATYQNLSLTVGGNVTLGGSGRLSVWPTPVDLLLENTITNIYCAATRFAIGGNLVVGDTATLYPWSDRYTGTSVRFEVASNLTVAAGAKIEAQGLGWWYRVSENDLYHTCEVQYLVGDDTSTHYETRALGPGLSFEHGAGHGDTGDAPTGIYGAAYGDPYAPFLPGSPAGLYHSTSYAPSRVGGGVVWIRCGRKIQLDGTINANAEIPDHSDSYFGGASGGSIWLAARGISTDADALLTARGGRSSYTYSRGAGGRISVALGVSDADLESLAMGERPEDLEYVDAIDFVTANVLPGTCGGVVGAHTGTVSVVKGPNADKTLNVTASVLAGSPSPVYGATAVAAGDTVTVTATTDGYGTDPSDPAYTRWTCAGYVVSNAVEELAHGDTASFSYTMPNEDVTVTWLWTNRQNAATVTVSQGAAYGSILFDGAAYESGTKAWRTNGASFTVEAVPAEGYEFLYWAGDFDYGKARTNPLTATAVGTGWQLRPVFRRMEAATTRTFLKTGNTTGDFLDESCWSGGNIPGLADDLVVTSGVCLAANNNYLAAKSLVVSNANARLLVGMTRGGSSYVFADAVDRTATAVFPSSISELADEVSLILTDDLIVAGAAQVGVGAPNAGKRAHGRIVAANITLADSAELLVTAGAIDDTFTFVSGAGFVEVTGAFTVADTAVYRPVSEPATGGSVKATVGSFSLAAGATVYARGQGLVRDATTKLAWGIGQGYDFSQGAGYGGLGGIDSSGSSSSSYGQRYGWANAPIHPGSPNGHYTKPYRAGGGLVRIHASGTVSVAGTVDVAAQDATWTETHFFGGASGGGIWLTARYFNLADGATFDVHGGDSTYASVGAGGRIALVRVTDPSLLASFELTGEAKGYTRSVSNFATLHPGVTINVAAGKRYKSSSHEFISDGPETANGTFRYFNPPPGLVLILR